MEDYIDFEDEQLYKDLAEQLAAAQAENGILQRCCEAWQYMYNKKDKELQDLQARYTQSLQQQCNMARTQEQMAELIAKTVTESELNKHCKHSKQ